MSPCCCLPFAKVTRPEVVSNLTPEEAEEAKKIKVDGGGCGACSVLCADVVMTGPGRCPDTSTAHSVACLW